MRPELPPSIIAQPNNNFRIDLVYSDTYAYAPEKPYYRAFSVIASMMRAGFWIRCKAHGRLTCH
jgi:hypothetical protein